MRANQPMGLTAPAQTLTEGLVRVDSGKMYEGYWNEEYPLAAYIAPDEALRVLTAEQERLRQRLTEVSEAIETRAQEHLAAGRFVYREYEQEVHYSSGPVMFLALLDDHESPVPASLWSACEMEVAAEGECRCRGRECVAGCEEGCLTTRDTEPR